MKALSEESQFFIFLLEQYALYKGINGNQALELLKKQNLVEYIYSMYYTYHTERIENAIADIENRLLIKNEPNHA
jgi:hypothetical protein